MILRAALLLVLASSTSSHAATYPCEGGTVIVGLGNGAVFAGPKVPAACSWIIGGPRWNTSLSAISYSGDPGFTTLAIFDAPGPDASKLVLRLEGYLDNNLLLASQTLKSDSGHFYVTFVADALSYAGSGFSAKFESVPASSAPVLVLPPPPRPSAVPSLTVAVGTLAGLKAALADFEVLSISLSAAITLDGEELDVPSGRSVTVLCGTVFSSGGCTLDAAWRSRLFRVGPSASLNLSSLTLANGWAVQGGAILGVGARVAVSSCVFRDSVSLGDGGAVLAAAGSNIQLTNCTFRNSTSIGAVGGAAAAVFGSQLTVSGGLATSCTAQGGGAFAAAFNSSVALIGAAVSTCSCSGRGGAATAMFSSTLTVTGSRIDACSSNFDGGCLHSWHGSSMLVTGTTLRGCSNGQGASGAAIAGHFSPNVTIVNSTIDSCTAPHIGGAIYAWHSHAFIFDSVIRNTSSGDAGGAIGVQGGPIQPWCSNFSWCGDAQLHVVRSVIRGTASASGGAIKAFGNAGLSVFDSVFESCTSLADSGGAILFDSGSQALTVSRSSFSTNRAPGCGAISVVSARLLELSDSELSLNEATAGDGGALCFAPPPLVQMQYVCVSNDVIELTTPNGDISPVIPGQRIPAARLNCTWAISAPAASGCVVQLTFAQITAAKPLTNLITVTDASTGLRLFSVSGSASPGSLGVPFTSTSEQGLLVRFTSASEGDLYLTGFTASFRHMCTTPSGAVAFSDVAALRLRNATIRNNVAAGFGGGVSLRVWPGYSGMRSATATLIGGTLMGNRAIRGGGGLFATSAVALTVAGGTAFASNIVTEGPGGAVYLLSTAVTSSISDARFEANLALADGGGALALDAASVDVRGCTFAANAARDDGGAVLASGGGNVTLAATRFEGNRAAFGGRGGAIAAVNVTSLTARSCAFLRNSVADRPAGSTDTVGGMSSFRSFANDGGSIFIWNPSSARVGAIPPVTLFASLTDCVIAGSTCSRSGGGVAAFGDVSVALANCTFQANRATVGGGALTAAVGAAVSIVSGALVDNFAGRIVASVLEADADNAGYGGAVWVGSTSTVSIRGAVLSRNEAEQSGGSAAVQGSGAVLRISSCTLSASAAIVDGGVFAVSGASALAVADSSISDASAFLGGFVSFRQGAAQSANLTLLRVALANVTASAGAIYATADSYLPFQAPQCVDCPPCSDCASHSFGQEVATLPYDAAVDEMNATRSGSVLSVRLTLRDGFGSQVREFLDVVAQIECRAAFIPGGASGADGCTLSTLLGAVRTPYTCACALDPMNGSALFSPLLLYGPPRAVFTLRASVPLVLGTTLGSFIELVDFNVTVSPCRVLEQWSPQSLLCGCAPGAQLDSATGECRCMRGFAFVPADPAVRADAQSATHTVGGSCVEPPPQGSRRDTDAELIASIIVPLGVVLIVCLMFTVACLALRARADHAASGETSVEKFILPMGDLTVVRRPSGLGGAAVAVGASGQSDPEGSSSKAHPQTSSTGTADAPPTSTSSVDGFDVLGGDLEEGSNTSSPVGPSTRAIRGLVIEYRGTRVAAIVADALIDERTRGQGPQAAARLSVTGWRTPGSEAPQTSSLAGVASVSPWAASVLAKVVGGLSDSRRGSASALEARSRGGSVENFARSSRQSTNRGSVGTLAPSSRQSTATGRGSVENLAQMGRDSSNILTDSNLPKEPESPQLASWREDAPGINSWRGRIRQPQRGSAARSQQQPRRSIKVDWSRTNLVERCQLRHPHIVTTFGAADVRGVPCLIEEFMSQNLSQLLASEVDLDYATLTGIALGVVAGTRYLHEATPPRVARLFSGDILVDSQFVPKIRMPFRVSPRGGLTVAAAATTAAPPALSLEASERSLWDAPEVLAGGAPTTAGDVYGFGILLLEILTRKPPFFEELQTRTVAAVLLAVMEDDLRPAFPETFQKAFKDVVIDCWHRNASRRPTFAEVGALLVDIIEVSRPAIEDVQLEREEREYQKKIIHDALSELADVADETEILHYGTAVLARILPDVQVVAVAALAGPAVEAATTAVAGNSTLQPQSRLYVQAEDAIADTAVTEALQASLVSHSRSPQQPAAARGGAGGLGISGPLGPAHPERKSIASRGTSLAWLLSLNRQLAVTSSTAPRGLATFDDWVAADSHLRPTTPTEVRKAWAALLRHGPGASDVVGYVLVVWVAPTPRFSVDGEDQVLREFCAVLGRAVHRNRVHVATLARQREQDAQRLQQRFLQNISHELRTPLNSVIGFTSLALEEELAPRVAEYLRESYNGATALLNLISKVLEFSRLNAMGNEPRRADEPLKFCNLASEIVDIVGPRAVMANVELMVVVDPWLYADPTLAGDRTGLRQAIVYLAENGIKFCKAGAGGEVTVSLAFAAGGPVTTGRAQVERPSMVSERAGKMALRPSDTGLVRPPAPGVLLRRGSSLSIEDASFFTKRTTLSTLHSVLDSEERVPAYKRASADVSVAVRGGFGGAAGPERPATSSGDMLAQPPLSWVPAGFHSGNAAGGSPSASGGRPQAAASLARTNSVALPPLLSSGRLRAGISTNGERSDGSRRAPSQISDTVVVPRLEIRVRDNGVGVPPELHHLLLRPFSQILSEDGAKSEGTGVGLASVKLLVDRMGGSITFSSAVGVGTTFTIVLPLTRIPIGSTLATSSSGMLPPGAASWTEPAPPLRQQSQLRAEKASSGGASLTDLLGVDGPPVSAPWSVLLAVRSQALQSALGQMLGCIRCHYWTSEDPSADLVREGGRGPPGLRTLIEGAVAQPLSDGAQPVRMESVVVLVTDAALLIEAINAGSSLVPSADMTIQLVLVGRHEEKERLRALSPFSEDFFLSRPVKLESFWRSIQLAAQRPPSQGSLAPFPAVLAAAESTSSAEWPSGLARRSQPGQQHGAAGSPAAPTRPPPHPYTSRGTLHKPPPAAPTGGLDQWACRVSLSEVEVVPVRPSVTDVGALRVMVVDDIALNLKVAVSLLKRLGVTVSKQAMNGVEAAEAAAEPPGFDLILMDMAMPIMGGVESTRRIREHERSIGAGPCRIVALTAHASPEDRDECLGAGMDAFLTKPVTLQALRDILAEMTKGSAEN